MWITYSALSCKWTVLTENVHRVCKNMWFLFVFVLCFYVCTHACFHLISNVHIIKTLENRILFQTFEKWHNVSYHYFSYFKLEASDIWKTAVWFLKAVSERIEENHIYHLERYIEGVMYVTKIFLENEKIDFKSKIWNFNIHFRF